MTYWKMWAEAAGIRALKTMGQTAAALLTVDGIPSVNVDWRVVLTSTLIAGVYSLCTSLAGLPEVKENKK